MPKGPSSRERTTQRKTPQIKKEESTAGKLISQRASRRQCPIDFVVLLMLPRLVGESCRYGEKKTFLCQMISTVLEAKIFSFARSRVFQMKRACGHFLGRTLCTVACFRDDACRRLVFKCFLFSTRRVFCNYFRPVAKMSEVQGAPTMEMCWLSVHRLQ